MGGPALVVAALGGQSVLQPVPAAEAVPPQQHPLDISNLNRALADIQRIEATLQKAIPGLQARAAAEQDAGELEREREADDVDAALLAQTEAEEERAERELLAIRRRALALGTLRREHAHHLDHHASGAAHGRYADEGAPDEECAPR